MTMPGFDPGTHTPATQWNYIPGHSVHIERIYTFAAQTFETGARVVEVGVMYGRSLAILEDAQRFHKKKFEVFGIDTWTGPPSMSECELWISALGISAKLIQSDSVAAAKEFEDNSCDMVFIDGDHSFEGCSRDIDAWLPKVKPGGFLAGHDYESTYPGVVAAVNLRFPGFTHYANETGICWLVKKAA